MNKGFRGWARPRHKVYVSAPTAIDTTNGNTFRHGFGRVPGLVSVKLLCVTANNGYLAGEEVPIDLVYFTAAGNRDGAPRWGIRHGVDAIRVQFQAASVEIVTSAGAIGGTFTFTEWRLVVRCADIERPL